MASAQNRRGRRNHPGSAVQHRVDVFALDWIPPNAEFPETGRYAWDDLSDVDVFGLPDHGIAGVRVG